MDKACTSTPYPVPGSSPPALSSAVSTMDSSKLEQQERPKFTPSVMVLQRRGLLTKGDIAQPAQPADDDDNDGNTSSKEEAKKRHGISLAYRGDPSVKGNRSADIDESQNTALFLQNMPPRCSYHELLSSFRDIGKVQSTHITPPGDGHRTSCAKVAFYTREAAEKLYVKIRNGDIIIRGYKLRCVWNRVKVAGYGEKWHSRILLVVGPEDQLSRQLLDAVLAENIVYDIDEVIDHGVVNGLIRLEYRFGSYTCQAQFAMKAIRAHFDEEQVCAEFGHFDPCELLLSD